MSLINSDPIRPTPPPSPLPSPGARATTSSILLHLDQLCGYEEQLREKENELKAVCTQLTSVEKVAARSSTLPTYFLHYISLPVDPYN